MAISLSDLFPMLRSAKGGTPPAESVRHWQRSLGRRKAAHKRVAAPRASAISFETIEPRVLLSADTVVGGLTGSLTTGLSAVGTQIDSVMEDDSRFDVLVPGIVQAIRIGDNAYQVSPTLREALEISADVAPDAGITPALADTIYTAFLGGGDDTLANRFRFVEGVDTNPLISFQNERFRDEMALRVMDLNDDSRVSMDEAFNVLVVGQIRDFLLEVEVEDVDGVNGINADDLALQLREFLRDETLFKTPDSVASWFNINVRDAFTAGSYDEDTGTLFWNLDFSLGLFAKEYMDADGPYAPGGLVLRSVDRFDLGYEAENLGIAIDPGVAPLANYDPYTLPMLRTAEFRSLVFGVRGADDGSVGEGDFFFSLRDRAGVPGDGLRLGFDLFDPTPADPYDFGLVNLGVNVGFLGAEIVNSPDTKGIRLSVALAGGTVDPSNPSALGFVESQQGELAASGTVEATEAVNLVRLSETSIEFTLRIGQGANARAVPVVLPQGTYADTSEVLTALNTALGGSVLNGIVTATDADTDGYIEFNVVATDPSPLGFAAEVFSSNFITAANAPAIIGSNAPQVITFLLSVNGAAPKKVVVTTTPADDDEGGDGDPNNGVTGLLSLSGLRADLQAAIDAAFGGGIVTVSEAGDRLRLSAPLSSMTIEISRSLTLDSLDQITLAELGGGAPVFSLDVASSSTFEVDLRVKALAGLKEGDTNTDYRPEGTIKVDIDPFTDVGEALVDFDPPTGRAILVADYAITDKDGKRLVLGESDLQKLLDFNVISAADMIGTFSQIGTWFDRLSASNLLQAFDLPFADTSLGDVLNLKDVINDALLIDDKDDGAKADSNDTAKLLTWLGDNLVAVFGTAQQLAKKLDDLLEPLSPDSVVGRVYEVGDGQELSYNIKLAGVSIDVDPQVVGDQPLVVPLDFQLDLGPLASVQTDGKLQITASGDVEFVLGVRLGDAVEVLDRLETDVASLNSNTGVRLNTNLALTSLGEIAPLVGRISGNAVFTVTTWDGDTPTNHVVTLYKSATDDPVNNTDDNKTLAHLLSDLNAALATAGLGGRIVAEAEPIQGDVKSSRLVLRSIDSSIDRFDVVAATNNPAYTELGLRTSAAATVWLVAPKPVPNVNPGAVDFTLRIVREGTSTDHAVSLPADATANNAWLQNLVDDLNGVLPEGIKASQSGGRLVLSAVDATITGFSITDTPALGFEFEAYKALYEAAGVNFAGSDPEELTAGAELRAGAAPLDPFGRLAGEVKFRINGREITIETAAATKNKGVGDLVIDLNNAIEADSGPDGLDGKVFALNEGGRIVLRAFDRLVADIEVTELSDSESAALGLANGSSADGLKLRSSTVAPVSYGVSTNTPFTLTINGTDYAGSLLRDNTILNRSLYDLAASLNNAMNAAVGGASKNPLVAVVQGGQIVIGIKTGLGANLIGPPAADNPMYVVNPDEVVSFGLRSASQSFVDELRLASATNVAYSTSDDAGKRGTAEFMIYFSNGSAPALITLDALDTDGDRYIDGKLGAVLEAIETQSGGRVSVEFGSGGTSLRLVDNTYVNGGANPGLFRVVAVNGSAAAAQLGILASDTTNVNLAEVPASATPIKDGQIDGSRIATIDLADRIYLGGLKASGDISFKTGAEPLSAQASFGFAGIGLSIGANQTLFSAEAEFDLFDGNKSLRELFDAFKNGGAGVVDLLGDPSIKLASDFQIDVSILPGLDISAFVEPVSPKITVKTNDVVIKLSDFTGVDPEAGKFLDKIDIETSGFNDLLKFKDVQFDNVLDAIQAIAQFLSQFEAFGFLDDDIPVLGVSVTDLLGIAEQFTAAVNDFRDNPAGGIQQLSQKILEALGLPSFPDDGNVAAAAFLTNLGLTGITPASLPAKFQLIRFAMDGNVLRFDLRLPLGFSKALNVDLDLGEALGVDLGPIDIQGGAGLAASGYLDARLSFGIDLTNPALLVIYDDVTGVFGGLHAGGSNLQFNAAIGPLGAFVKDGRADINLDFFVTGDDGVAGPASLPDFLSNLQANLTGSASATLPVYFPTDSMYLGDVEFSAGFVLDSSDGLILNAPNLELPDFSNIDLTALNPFASIGLMLDALDFFLMGLQDVLDGEVFGVELPLIGNQLAGGVDFIEQMRRDLIKPLRQYIEQAPQIGGEIVQALLYELLAEKGAQGKVTVDGNVIDIETLLGIAGDIQGLNLLKDGPDLDGIISQDDVRLTVDPDDGAEWVVTLGGDHDLKVPLEFDLGIPAIALEMNTALQFSLEWGLTFGVGISLRDGAYIYVGEDDELSVKVAVDIANQPPVPGEEAAIRGELGFLQLEVWEDGEAAAGLEGGAAGGSDNDPTRGTFLQAEFAVDLKESGATGDDAKRVSFSELGNLDAEVKLSADAEVNLLLKAAFNESLLPPTISALLPSIGGRFTLDWETGNILAGDFDFAESLELLGFRDVEVDMGSFINDLVKPFVDKIAEVTGPLQPIIDVITAPLPVVSQLAGKSVSLADLAGAFGEFDPGMIYAVADIISLVNKIGNNDYGAFALPLGDFMLLDKSSGNSNFLTGEELLTPGYTLAGDEKFDQEKLDQFLKDTLGELGEFGDLLADGIGDALTQGLVSDLSTGSEGGAGFEFPIFENPASLFGLLLGKDVPLITYDLAPLKMEFSYVQKFPIWDALFIRLGGSVGLTIDLAFGYDTAGVRQFADSGFTNPLTLIGGLYISDTNKADGTGTDVPELILKGELFAGAELNLGIASAGADGVIGLVTNFDLYDPNSDGKVRIDELVGNFLYEWNYGSPALAPVAIFDVYGEIYAQLRAFVEALFFKIEFDITPPITLFEFSIPFERAPILATERGDGSLLLNVGQNSAQRLNGDTRDIGEKIYVESLSDTEVLVWGMGLERSGGQKYKIEAGQSIFAYGGDGNDLIDLSLVTHNIKYVIEGGAGDDELKGGQSGGRIDGGTGNDTITGGGGVDLIVGGEGNDTIDGMGDADVIFGDTGSVSNVDGGKRYRTIVGEKDGDDRILGGAGNDIILGGGGSDWIEGGADDDIVLGDGGNFDFIGGQLTRLDGRYDVNARGLGAKDTILGGAGNDALFGGAGDDLVDGGADSDEIEGGDGFDVVYGGSGADTIYGGNQDDIIFGYRDPRGADFGQAGDTADLAGALDAAAAALADGIDHIYGEEGNDFIRGQGGNDVIRGGRGADVVFGDTGNDEIYGEAGGDIVFGGADDDTLDGADGADIVFGDDGLVAYIDFDMAKADFNFTGSRIRFLGGDQLIGDSDVALLGGYTGDGIATSMDLIVTRPLASDGSDTIIGGNGDDIVFGGGGLLDTLFGDYNPGAAVPFVGPRPSGKDILIGDGGRIELTGRRVDRAAAVSDALDGKDVVTGNDGGDYMFGGGHEDTLYGFLNAAGPAGGTQPLDGVSDNDVILGDNGEILFDTSDAQNRIEQIRTTWVAGDSGRSDVIRGNFGNDVVFGGLNSSSDYLYGDDGDDILVGDQGEVIFDADGDLDTVDLVRSFADNIGGDDVMEGNLGRDVLIGGTGADVMAGNDGEDILLGDNARIELTGPAGRLLVQVAAMPAATAIDFITTTDVLETTGGADIMSGNAGNDILFGGVNNGGVDTMYGDSATPVNAVDGDDILVGDNGLLDFTLGPDTDRMTLDIVRSLRDGLGGTDVISGNAGSDIAIGGTGGDEIYGDNALASAGALDLGDILLGDNADVLTRGPFNGPARLRALGTGIAVITTTDTAEGTGGIDTISGSAGADVIAGGVAGDVLYGDRAAPNPSSSAIDGDDVILGDNGRLEFDRDLNGDLTEKPAAEYDLTTLDRIESFTDGLGGVDTISGNAGADTAVGGTAGDVIYGDDATASGGATDKGDILLGDNGYIQLVSPTFDATVNGTDRILILGGAVALVRSTDQPGLGPDATTASDTGGIDTISGNAGGDVILGGVAGDVLYGDRATPTAGTNVLDGNDIILGDNGALEWLSAGRLGEITGIDLPSTNADLVAGFAVRDTNLDTLDLITTEQPNNGGRDLIFGDNARDVIMGGTDADELYGDTGSEADGIQGANGNDLMFGDHGRLYPQFSRFMDANGNLVVASTIYSRNFFAIDIGAGDGGEGDRMWGEEGADIMLGQQGDDRMWGGSGDDDMVGGHNVSGGADELALAGEIRVVINGDAFNDVMDGGSGNDAMAGDNATIWRRGDSIDPRFRTLAGDAIYTTTEDTIEVNVTATHRADPAGTVGRDITLRDHADDTNALLFGRDVMAGGADRDTMFGQLGNDLMQGDGGIRDEKNDSYTRPLYDLAVADVGGSTGQTLKFDVPEAATDGDDYMEGNGGNDLMYGGLGQDDMIGGSSDLFGLTTRAMRPDGSDTMYGGAGLRLARLDTGDIEGSSDHARDSDQMVGDNATVYRLVSLNNGTTALLAFNYDNYGATKIVVRGVNLLDYTLGGPDYDAASQANDRGAGDYIRGEAGNDFIHGMSGSDILFGDAHDDDLIGGYGHDWISGGTGQDGVIGDDGIIRTSRNSDQYGEPLYGIAALLSRDPNTKDSNGNVLNEVISTPGGIQTATINVAGQLTKSVDLTPISVDPDWAALDDEYGYGALGSQGGAPFADDIIYGGLDSDWLHGGSGDDAISGAEGLTVFFDAAAAARPQFFGAVPASRPSLGTDDASTVNPGNVLRFNAVDEDGWKTQNRQRAGEFALYDEYDPLRAIRVSAPDGWSGDLVKDGSGFEFILNFNPLEGTLRPSETVPTGGNTSIVTGPVNDDGDDRIFGGTGNDWMVGGTGKDAVYGGWGNDLMNVDDDHRTNGGLNDQPDTHSTYEDRAYGGAGRDVLIGNTGGDRLIDWVGEFNSYLVPFAPFGMATVSRTLQPQLPEFLYALSRAHGADPTIVADGNGTAERNGEPFGELGLVLQKDFAWQDQTGAPADPQAGNIPGGKRDVLRSADFNDGKAQSFVAESGSWRVTSGKYEVAPLPSSGTTDAISLFNADAVLPTYFEVAATINAIKPTAGFKANAYIVFDYVSPTNFKFAGLNLSTNKIEIGQRTATGWQVLNSINLMMKAGTEYNVLLAVNGNAVTFMVNNKHSLSHAFTPRSDADGFTYAIRDGMFGLGGDNARARIDNLRVQVIPPAITYAAADLFDGVASTLLAGNGGTWSVVDGRFVGVPAAGAPAAIASNGIAVGVNSMLQVDTVVNTAAVGGIVFDMYSPSDFKWAAVSVATQQVLIGHYTAKGGWVVDAAVARTLSAGADHALSVTLKGTTASVAVGGQTVLSKVFNSTVVDGAAGVFSRGGSASFDRFGVATDDARYAEASGSSAATGSAKTASTSTAKLSPNATDSTVGASEGWRIDWSALNSTTRGVAKDGAAKGKAKAWQQDFALNLGGRPAKDPNSSLRVRL